MKILNAKQENIERLLQIFDIGRQTMRNSGNMTQWINGYPSLQLLSEDIKKNQLFVVCDDDADEATIGDEKIHGVFAFIVGEDKTYNYIEDGNWTNDNPYGTIHRIASDNTQKGILRAAVDFGLSKINTIRIDTHADNKIMQNAVTKCGFKRCGIIYIEDDSPRIAFQLN